MEDYLTTLTIDLCKLQTSVAYFHTHCGGLSAGDRETVRAKVAKIAQAISKVKDCLQDIAARDAPPSPILVD